MVLFPVAFQGKKKEKEKNQAIVYPLNQKLLEATLTLMKKTAQIISSLKKSQTNVKYH